jgi:electron transport complex protein RnfD
MPEGNEQKAPVIHVAPGPHLSDPSFTTRRMMVDVLIGLLPVTVMAVWIFGVHALQQIAVCVVSCMLAEAVFHSLFRRRPLAWGDFSALVTGVILALSFPWSAPWWVGAVGGMTAIGLGKAIFGGVGMNIFNPAMVGRAFVMISFGVYLAAPAYVSEAETDAERVYAQATPLTAAKQTAAAVYQQGAREAQVAEMEAKVAGAEPVMKSFYRGQLADAEKALEKAKQEVVEKKEEIPAYWPLFLGTVNGSLGEVSVLLCLLGGLYLCWRRTASWEIPASIIAATALFGGIIQLAGIQPEVTVAHHLLGGSLFFGAFFIATDPVTNPLTAKGKVIFGAGIGFFIILIRVFSGYPEGVMFAVLLMNGVVPLINNWTIPTPKGGPLPARK